MDAERRVAQRASEEAEKEILAGLTIKQLVDAKDVIRKIKLKSKRAREFPKSDVLYEDLTTAEKDELKTAVEKIRHAARKRTRSNPFTTLLQWMRRRSPVKN